MTHPHPPASFVSTVQYWARTRPDAPSSTYVDYRVEPEGVARTWTYAQLDERARLVAAAVREVAGPGDRVMLMLPQGLEYIAAFLGCLYAGVISVPLFEPEAHRSSERLTSVLADAAPAASLTDTPSVDAVRELSASGVKTGTVLAVDALDGTPTAAPVHCAPEETAYLQYTSGSTRAPAGVVVSHGNLWANTSHTRDWLDLCPGETYAGWGPFFHDMGLVYCLAATLRAGAHGVWMSPQAFVHRPARWLRLASDYAAVGTAAPNFGLDMAVRKVTDGERAGLDLSRLRALSCASEPVREATLREFADTYAPYGFHPRQFAVAWGLAEATVLVAAAPVGRGPRVVWCDRAGLAAGRVDEVAAGAGAAVPIMGCGVPQQQEVRIVDPETGVLADPDTLGEAWVHGPNVAHGYYQRPEQTAEVFGHWPREAAGTPIARPADPCPEYPGRGWMRTGDIGFLRDGEMFWVSRTKDLIIVAGANHHPIDIENTVSAALPGMRSGHVAAFQVDERGGSRGATGLVIVAELDRRRMDTVDTTAALYDVRRQVAVTHGVEVDDIVLARPGTIPKTSSGKIRRRACARLYEGEMDTVVARLRG